MLLSADPAARARWEVLFKHKGKVRRIDCGTSLPKAIKGLLKAEANPACKGATLRCKNMGFPPPAELQPHEVERVVTKTVKGKPKRVRRKGIVTPLRKLNTEGVFWCPYCMKLRRFILNKFVGGNRKLPDGKHIACPWCGIRSNDHHVAKWNPGAAEIAWRVEATKSTSGAQ